MLDIDFITRYEHILSSNDIIYISEQTKKHKLKSDEINTIKIHIIKHNLLNQKMKIEKYESKYITPKEYDINEKVNLSFVDSGKIVSGKYGQQYEFMVKDLKNPSEVKILTISGEIQNGLIDFFGDETKTWVDKTFSIMVVQNDKSPSGKKFVLV